MDPINIKEKTSGTTETTPYPICAVLSGNANPNNTLTISATPNIENFNPCGNNLTLEATESMGIFKSSNPLSIIFIVLLGVALLRGYKMTTVVSKLKKIDQNNNSESSKE